jgi:ATP-dependent Clp protease ATP-binding subunit ClpC
MRRAVERFLEDPMAEEILRGNIKPGESVGVTRSGEKLIFEGKETGTKPEPAAT